MTRIGYVWPRLAVAAALGALCLGTAASARQGGAFDIGVDSDQVLADVATLAADDMEGRAVGSPGGIKARNYVHARFAQVGLQPFGDSFLQPFNYESQKYGGTIEGANLLGFIPGELGAPLIVVTAHYDHLGVVDGAVYNGADDNASGVAALLEAARYFVAEPPRHTIVFAAIDAEEDGREGSKFLVANPPVPLETVALNVNLDMLSQSDKDELFVAGAFHSPWLAPWLEQIADEAAVVVLQGHDSPSWGENQDWTTESDHRAFHEAGVPFVYFGVEDHPQYHQPTDDADAIPVDFFLRAVATVVHAIAVFDGDLEAIEHARATWEEDANALIEMEEQAE
jgi:Zn-dependent M28 family amino/carboxypeptidase